MPGAYLTVPQVAAELDMSPDGVYKLIKRGRLPAIRRSERGLRVSRVALAAYLRRLRQREVGRRVGGVLQGDAAVDVSDAQAREEGEANANLAQLRAEFERETDLSPHEWERRWKADELEDSAENMRLAIRALGLLVAEQ